MDTTFRDNAIAKNRILLKMALAWALSMSVAVMALSFLCFYAFKHKQTHWLPVCTSEAFSVGESAYSPAYIKEMSKKVMDLRMTYNPETVASRFLSLLHLIPVERQEDFKKILDSEIKTVQDKNISSVFYEESIAIDNRLHIARVKGYLQRTRAGLQIKPQYKGYQIQFAFKNGLLWPQSIQEMHDELH